MKTTNDQVMEWLGAYLDGELSGERAAWVEAHLADCPECQRELESLAALTSLLHSTDDAMPRITPALSAAALPDQSGSRASLWLGRGLRYLPLAVFGGWAFLQAVLWVTGGLMAFAAFVPGAQSALGWLLPEQSGTPFIASLLCGLQPQGGLCATLGAIDALPIAPGTGLLSILITAVAAALFMAWFAGYWAQRRSQSETIETGGTSARTL